MHDPRSAPGFARTYQHDPTPARHVKGGMGMMQMMMPPEAKYNYEGTGPMDVGATCGTEIKNVSGLCVFSDFGMPPDAAAKLIAAEPAGISLRQMSSGPVSGF